MAINGFGRIGRQVFKAIYERDDLEVVAINGLMDAVSMCYLTRYDSTQGRFPGHLEAQGDYLVLDGRPIPLSSEPQLEG